MANRSSSPPQEGPATSPESLLSNRVFDRQIRLWGVESQRRLLSSHVLLVGLTSIHVELAKNLALSGVRVSLCDSRSVGEIDFAFNFLVKREAEGQRVASASLAGLRDMAPFVAFEELPESEFQRLLAFLGEEDALAKTQKGERAGEALHAVQLVARFTAICVASEFYPLSSLPQSTLIRFPFGCVVSFFAGNAGSAGYPLSTAKCCPSPLLTLARVPAPKSEKTQAGVSGEAKKGEDGEDESLPQHDMKEKAYPSLDEMMHCSLGKADRKVDPALLVYLTMQKWQADKEAKGEQERKDGTTSRTLPLPRYDSLPEDDDFAHFTKQELRQEGGPAAAAFEQSPILIKTLPMMWGRQYTVTAAIVGGVLAQELRKYITKEQEPIPNCLLFNADSSTAAVASLPPSGVSVSVIKTP
ncbi:hypothetical protein NCLIV_011590 [Neospora caninum Liverpool]|uniref:THIF-type NAD/FAD binding fold domain-containing protein n=1 Tax=Neospora caninum (strain Liverpool) TaxID=572307 RepID=F0VAK3_NEOCL|nr:hypothetical protein NCLIV_011590 [Neospora caninum Liverpool]CBZ50692.1 hypothetical protein NCLIV_011590 [Neospora caninum Liverpool]|eukprot:XP_003880725.1 hypothetical protein NCLIV_011590 [Neospora caninum Liverpool]